MLCNILVLEISLNGNFHYVVIGKSVRKTELLIEKSVKND